MEWMLNGTTLLLCLFGLMAIGGFGLAKYFGGRMRTVEQGYVAVIHWMDRFARVVEAGPYWLRPFEEEIVQVYVRQREASASAPKIFTDGGFGVAVDLRYAYRLDPARMPTDELYYSDTERKKQHEMLIREVLLDLVQELKTLEPPKRQGGQAADAAKKDPASLDMGALFSPFGGFKETVLRSQLKQRVSQALLPHGAIITSETVQIAGLTLPPGLGAAIAAYVEAPFSASAHSEFVRRVRAVEPNLSDAALVQLLNILQNPSAEIQTIFTTGAISPDILLDANGAQVRQRLGSAPAQSPQQGQQTPQSAQQPAQQPETPETPAEPPRTSTPLPPPTRPGADDEQAADAAGRDYPLVASDNALLKSTRVEYQGWR